MPRQTTWHTLNYLGELMKISSSNYLHPQNLGVVHHAISCFTFQSLLLSPPVVMRKSEAGSSEVQAEVGGAGGGATGPLVAGRSRSKTFEEYERDTTDAWDDREEREDMSRLSVPAELENELKQQQLKETCSDSAPAPPRRREGRGKGSITLLSIPPSSFSHPPPPPLFVQEI